MQHLKVKFNLRGAESSAKIKTNNSFYSHPVNYFTKGGMNMKQEALYYYVEKKIYKLEQQLKNKNTKLTFWQRLKFALDSFRWSFKTSSTAFTVNFIYQNRIDDLYDVLYNIETPWGKNHVDDLMSEIRNLQQQILEKNEMIEDLK